MFLYIKKEYARNLLQIMTGVIIAKVANPRRDVGYSTWFVYKFVCVCLSVSECVFCKPHATSHPKAIPALHWLDLHKNTVFTIYGVKSK